MATLPFTLTTVQPSLSTSQPLFVSGYGQYHSNEEGVQNPKPYQQIGLDGIRQLVDNPQQVDKAQAQWLIASTYPSRSFKEQEEKGQYWFLWADIDHHPNFEKFVEIIELTLPGYDYEAYTTSSATEQNQKARLLILLAKPLCHADWHVCQELLNDHLEAHGVTPDRASERAAQLCYLPNRGAFYKSSSSRNGVLFDPITLWATQLQQKRDEIKAASGKLDEQKNAAVSKREALKLSDAPDTIGAFNQAYTVQEVLSRAGYAQQGNKFRHTNSSSGSYSASVENDRVHSLSTSDQLYTNGGDVGGHDAFSAFTVLFHNNNQKAALNDAGDNWLTINGESWNTVKQREFMQGQVNIANWQTPISLESCKLSPWPNDIFPKNIQDFVTTLSTSTETPPELSAMMVLATISAASQGKYRVKVKPDYFEPVNIWTCAALPPGSRKTAVQTAATAPLSTWEKLQREKLEPEIEKALANDATMREQINYLRKKASKAEGANFEQLKKEIADIEAALPEIPKIPQIWAQDVTPENLGTIMANNNERMAILSDEAGIFDILGGRYSGGIPNLDLFLQGHAGSPVRVNRGSRPPVFMQAPALTMGLSPQPDVLRGLTEKPSFRGRGLLGRFLYALPPSNLGSRTLDAEPMSPNYRTRYAKIITAILNHELSINDKSESCPHTLRISSDALKSWHTYALKIEAEMREGGTYAHLTDWARKLPGAAVRIAALLHIARHALVNPWEKEISIDDMVAALHVADVLTSHALVVFDLMGADPALDGARQVLRWIKREGKPEFTFRDCHYAHKTRYKRAVDLEPAINILLERHFIQRRKINQKQGRSSRMYEVNPVILQN